MSSPPTPLPISTCPANSPVAWLDRFLAESRPLFHHLPHVTALFLTGYGERFSPEYLGNWIKKLLKRCGIDKPCGRRYRKPMKWAT